MAKNKLNKVIVIVGPTASGKTDLALKLAKKYSGEIISADSRQIYRGMDIGTAKVTQDQISNIKNQSYKSKFENRKYRSSGIFHYLIDIKNPNQDYSAGQFKKDATKAIRAILRKGKLPIIVGGTGLYISSLVNGLVLPPVKENKKLRAQIESEIKTKGLDFVFKKLVALDRKAAHVVDRRNPRRIIRALEVAILTGEPFTAQRKIEKPSFDFLQIGLSLPKDVLRQRIERRVDQMIKRGLVREVKNLVKKYGENQIAFDAIGYREIIDFLNGKTGLNEAIEKIKKNTWHYARRQLAWFKRDKKVNWLDNIKTIESTAKKWLSP